MNKLTHFMLPQHTNNLYKNEAISSIALTKNVASKINELVDAYNELSKVNLEKIQEQDGKIRKGVLYMKDNLLNTLSDLMDTLTKSGFIDERIEAHISNLIERVDNLLGSIKEGSTTLDAEVIDIRVDNDGTRHSNAGESVRNQFKKASSLSNIGIFLFDKDEKIEVIDNAVRITFPAPCHVIHGTGNKYKYDGDLIIEFEKTNAASLFAFCFDTKTKVFIIKNWTDKLSVDEIILGYINTYVGRFESLVNAPTDIYKYLPDTFREKSPIIWCSYPPDSSFVVEGTVKNHTIKMNDIYYLCNNVFEKIPARDITFTSSSSNTIFAIYYNKLDDEYIVLPIEDNKSIHTFIGFYHVDYGVLINSVSPAGSKSLCTMLSSANGYPSIDTINKKIIIRKDTLLKYDSDPQWLQLCSTDTEIDYSSYSSSALCLYFDLLKKEFIIKEYFKKNTINEVLIMTIRTNQGGVACSLPVIVDGKLFGINLDNEVSIEYTDYIKAINHRGYNVEAPENTLSAYRLSKKKGFRYVECDVRFTSDNIAVLLHDATIDRTSNGSGNISQLTYEYVRSLDFGNGEVIPTFEEFINLCRNLGLHPYIELKEPVTSEQVQTLITILKKYNMLNNVTWISFSKTILEYVLTYHQDARIGYTVDNINETVITTAETLKNDNNEVFINSGSFTEAEVNLCVNAAIPLEVWTVDNNSTIATLHPYISGVTSNSIHVGKLLYDMEV